jgi:hypothetical protein
LDDRPWLGFVEVAAGDVLEARSLVKALDGVTAA